MRDGGAEVGGSHGSLVKCGCLMACPRRTGLPLSDQRKQSHLGGYHPKNPAVFVGLSLIAAWNYLVYGFLLVRSGRCNKTDRGMVTSQRTLRCLLGGGVPQTAV